MTQVYTQGNARLMFCCAEEYEQIKESGEEISALLCAKHPYHKQIVGYIKNCPKDHPEYLVAYRRDQHLMALNMVDVPNPAFFSDEMVNAGLDFIEHELASGRDVVVVCNKGESRSATMCLMYMMRCGCFEKTLSHSEVFDSFARLAPSWNPSNGILQYAIQMWNNLREDA